MYKYLGLSKYHLAVLGLYVVAVPLLFIFTRHCLNYSFFTPNFGQALGISLVSLVVFYFIGRYFGIGLGKVKVTTVYFSASVVYAVCFALPEEIIFRGIIQQFLQNKLGSAGLALLLAAIIFGLAHLPNSAKGLNFKLWNWKFAALTFLAALPLGWAFAITGSLLIPTLLHAALILGLKLLVDTNRNLEYTN